MASLRRQDFMPLITDALVSLMDGKVDADEANRLLDDLKPLVARLREVAAKPEPVQPPAPPVIPTPPVQPPVAPAAALKVARIVAKLTGIYDRSHHEVTPDPLPGVLRGDNWDNGFFGHSDATLILTDGSEVRPGDPRWAQLNHWAPNGNPVFPYYEYNGALTDIRHGDHGSDFVDPTSFEDDNGCTVTWQVDTPAPHNTQAHFRFGYMYQDFDGSYVESGLIGQGNVAGGAPFNIR